MKEGWECKELGLKIVSRQAKEDLIEKVKSEQIP